MFNSVEKSRELYRKYEAYVIGSKGNISVRFYFEDSECSSVIVEVSNRFHKCVMYDTIHKVTVVVYYLFQLHTLNTYFGVIQKSRPLESMASCQKSDSIMFFTSACILPAAIKRLRSTLPAQHVRPSGFLCCWSDGLELTT